MYVHLAKMHFRFDAATPKVLEVLKARKEN